MNLNKLKSKRVELSLKQEDVAQKMNVSIASYCRKEMGKREFKHSELVSLVDILNLSNNEIQEIFFC